MKMHKTLVLLAGLFSAALSAKAASAATIQIPATWVYKDVAFSYSAAFFDTSQLVGKEIEGIQFVTSSQLSPSLGLLLSATDKTGTFSSSVFQSSLGSSNFFQEVDELVTPSGNTLIEPFMGTVVNSPFGWDEVNGAEIMSFLEWLNLQSTEGLELQLSGEALIGKEINDLTLRVWTTTAAVPEPSSFAALAGVTVLGLAALRRRRRA